MLWRLCSALLVCSTLVLVATAVPTGNGHGHGHGHSALAANGQTCNMSNQCQSEYCHRGTCDVKKPNGHVCYKNAGCLSGKCKDKKCRPASGHASSMAAPTSSIATAMSSKVAPTSSTASPTSSKASTPSSMASTVSSTASTASSTASTTSSTASTASSTASTTPSQTSTTATPLPTDPKRGELIYEAQLANPDPSEFRALRTFQGFIEERTTGDVFASRQSVSQNYYIEPEHMWLKSAGTGNILTTNGAQIYAKPEDVGFNLVNGFPFVCSSEGETTDSQSGHPATQISCVASVFGQQYSEIYICSDDRFVADLHACADGDSANRKLVTRLLIGEFGEK